MSEYLHVVAEHSMALELDWLAKPGTGRFLRRGVCVSTLVCRRLQKGLQRRESRLGARFLERLAAVCWTRATTTHTDETSRAKFDGWTKPRGDEGYQQAGGTSIHVEIKGFYRFRRGQRVLDREIERCLLALETKPLSPNDDDADKSEYDCIVLSNKRSRDR